MRPIDADKTLETLEGLTEPVIGEGAALVKALTFAALKSESVVPTIGGWISVGDRLPEDGQEVVVRVIRGHFDVATYDASTKKWDTYEDAYEFERITHWVPLHEPPEEVSGK